MESYEKWDYIRMVKAKRTDKCINKINLEKKSETVNFGKAYEKK